MALTKLKDIKDQARRVGLRGLGGFTKKDIMQYGSRTALGLEVIASMIRAYIRQRERVGLDGTPRAGRGS